MLANEVIKLRPFLYVAVIALIAGNIAFFADRHHDSDDSFAALTYVGTDSFTVIAPANHPTAMLRRGVWQPNPANVSGADVEVDDQAMLKRRVPLITAPTYGQFIRSVRDLKVHGVCNVAIVEAGTPLPDSEGFLDQLEIPTIFLCGYPLGDAGYVGEIPPDELIRLPRDN